MSRVTPDQMRRAALRGDVASFDRMARAMRQDVITEYAGKFASRVLAPFFIGLGQAVAGAFEALTRRPADVGTDRLTKHQRADIGLVTEVGPLRAANDIDRDLDRVA